MNSQNTWKMLVISRGNINVGDALCTHMLLHYITLCYSCGPSYLTVPMLIYGVYPNETPCNNELLFEGPMPQLQDSNRTTCVTPLKKRPKSARITAKSDDSTYSMLRVLLDVSPQTRCYSPGITVAAKPSGSAKVVECFLLDENNSLLITCTYLCHYRTGLDIVYVVYQNIDTKGVNNVMWELCEIKVWALGWIQYKWHIGGIHINRVIKVSGELSAIHLVGMRFIFS